MRFAHTRHGCRLHGRRPTPHRNFLRNLSLAINLEISEKSLIWGNDFMRDYAFRIVSSMGILFCQSKGLVHYNRTRIHVIYHATAHGCSWLRWNMDHNLGVIPQGILCPLYANTWIFQKKSHPSSIEQKLLHWPKFRLATNIIAIWTPIWISVNFFWNQSPLDFPSFRDFSPTLYIFRKTY